MIVAGEAGDVVDAFERKLISRVIRQVDFNRAPFSGVTSRGTGYKEWLHFCVRAGGVDVLVNFSAVEEGDGRAFRTIALVRAPGTAWRGDITRVDPSDVSMPGGLVGLRFARSSVKFQDGVYRLRAVSEKLDLDLDVVLLPTIIPTQTLNMEVRDGPPHNWAITPRLLATGTLRLGEETHPLQDAPAYHDHNWGAFQWGGDFAWEWGYAIPDDPTCPWTVVAVRFADRAHTHGLAQGLFLWKGARQHRIFRGRHVDVTHHGLASPSSLLKLPPVMGLLRPGTSTDVPQVYEMYGRDREDHLRLRFDAEEIAQVMLPNDRETGMTIIHEVAGRFEVDGMVFGERVAFAGGGVFEFLGS